MAEDPIPADVREFIVKNIDSIAYLEALLLLRAHQATVWNASSVAARLYIEDVEAAAILSRLVRDGFAKSQDERYSYECLNEVDTMVDRVATVYARHLIPVTNLIHSRPGSIRAFASAFKLRKDP